MATLQGFSKNYCSVYPHPFNPNVVLTVSDDGNVVIWDLSRRVVLTGKGGK